MNRICLSALVALSCVLALYAAVTSASVPELINYQGALRDTANVPVPDGNYSVTFRVWPDSAGGSPLWAEGRLITVKKGLFNILLGAIVPIPDDLFDNPDRWLGVQIGLDPEMAPRSRLVTVPYAGHAHSSDRADTAAHSLDKTTNASELTGGTLDTGRFSAYADLINEGRIGDQAGHVARGDHVHALGALNVAEDTTTVSTVLIQGAAETVLKSIFVPPGQVGHYIHILAHAFDDDAFCQNGTVRWRLLLNGFEVYKVEGGNSSTPSVLETRLFKVTDPSGTRWFISAVGIPYDTYRNIDISSGITLELTAAALLFANCSIRAHEFLLEYESH